MRHCFWFPGVVVLYRLQHKLNNTELHDTTDNSLVRFAIIADLTGGERAGVFKVGAKAINAMKPDFIMSIGDLIEGGTEDIDQMNKEWVNLQ